MKILHLTKTLFVAGAALVCSHSSRASLAAFTDLSLGGTTASWDLFYGANYLPTFTFTTGTVGNSITNAGSNLNLVANVPGYVPGTFSTWASGPIDSNGSTVPGNRELFYTFFAPLVNFNITSKIADSDVLTTYTFQSLISPGSAGGLSNVLLNGSTATSSGTASGVNYWTWTGLNLSAGDVAALTFSTTAQHSVIDAVQIQSDAHLTAVPEPSVTAAAIGAALVGLILIRRRNARKA